MNRILLLMLMLLSGLGLAQSYFNPLQAPPIVGTIALTPAVRAAATRNVREFGAKGDGLLVNRITTVAAFGTALTTSVATFRAADVGKTIVVGNAGEAEAAGIILTVPVDTPGYGYTSVPSCTVADTGAGTGALCVALMKIVIATLTSEGAGCMDGAGQVFFTAMDGIGKQAQIIGTVTGGVLAGTLAVVDAGLFTALGAANAVPAYGANCTTPPTLGLSFGVAAVQFTKLGAGYSRIGTTVALTGNAGAVASLGAPHLAASLFKPHTTTITAFTSATAVTLSVGPPTALVAQAVQLLVASNDTVAVQAAISAGPGAIYFPAGLYWIPVKLDPGTTGSRNFFGDGMESSILMHDSGTMQTQNGVGWSPMFANLNGSHTAIKDNLHFEGLQFRGLLDFGRIGGAAVMELNFYNDLSFDRVKFFQVPNFSMAAEAMNRYRFSNSVIDSSMRDGARCRSCFNVIIRGNHFLHSDDDSVALHQASYLQGAGNVREGIIIEGNTFEDTHGISMIGARLAVVRGNIFRRNRIGAIRLAIGGEGVNPVYAINIADNLITDSLARLPFGTASSGITLDGWPSTAPTGITGTRPGQLIPGTDSYLKPWDFSLGNAMSGTAYAAGTRGFNIHDNTIMRTLPAVAKYSDWGFGPMLSSQGWVDPPVPNEALTPTAGISASGDVTGLLIHHNQIQNVRRGISLSNNSSTAARSSISIDSNQIYDAWEYGVVNFASLGTAHFALTNNVIDVDPLGIAPGRTGRQRAWSAGNTRGRCFYNNVSGLVTMTGNTFSNC